MLSYGGLRGAVGLALALQFEQEEAIDDRLRVLVLLHASGIALLTLLINGSTTGIILSRLGMTDMSLRYVCLSVCPQLFALNCLPSTVCPQLT